MDVKALQAMEVAAKASRKVLRLGTKTKEIVWRRRGIMQPEVIFPGFDVGFALGHSIIFSSMNTHIYMFFLNTLPENRGCSD
jgi:hypothetical protein